MNRGLAISFVSKIGLGSHSKLNGSNLVKTCSVLEGCGLEEPCPIVSRNLILKRSFNQGLASFTMLLNASTPSMEPLSASNQCSICSPSVRYDEMLSAGIFPL